MIFFPVWLILIRSSFISFYLNNILSAELEPVYWFSSHSGSFYSYENVTIVDEGLQMLTYAQHSWPLSSEGSLAWHAYCDMGHPFIMVISDDPWHLHLL